MRLILTLALLCTLAACDTTEPAPAAEALLTASPWVPRSADSVPVASATRYVFEPDGTLLLEFEGHPPEEETWTLSGNGAVLTVYDGGASRAFRVDRLDDEGLDLTYEASVPGGPTHSYQLVHP